MSSPSSGPFQTGYSFGPTEVVTNLKLDDIVNLIQVNYPALAQAIMNSGSGSPNALIRFQNYNLQLRNDTTGLWHPIWVTGNPGEEEIVIGQGTT
jgi:hypothetical protein